MQQQPDLNNNNIYIGGETVAEQLRGATTTNEQQIKMGTIKKRSRSHKHHLATMGSNLVVLLTCCCLLFTATLSLAQTTTEPTSTMSEATSKGPSEVEQPASSLAPISLADLETSTLTSGPNSVNNQQKLKPINFTLVDEVFESVLSDDEVLKRWKSMDGQIQDGIKSILKMVFPQIVSISQDARVSGDCSGGILKWILSLRNLRSWAIKMLDATGKPTAGVFEGSLTMFGNYRQCLSIRAPDEDEIEITEQFEEYFRGQFCVLHLKPWMPVKKPFYHLNSTIESLLRKNYKYYEKTLYDELAEIAIAFNFIDIRLDLCVPSTCTVADIQRVAELLSKKLEMRAKVMRCDIASRELNIFNHIDRPTYVWLVVPLILLALSLFATFLSFLVRFKSFQSPETNTKSTAEDNGKLFITILQCLSIGSTLKARLTQPGSSHQFSTAQNQGDEDLEGDTESESSHKVPAHDRRIAPMSFLRKPLPLYGLRSVFVFWFIIVQMTVELKYQYLRESLSLRNMLISYWPFQIIINSVLLFESLILITAFTYSYTCLESSLKDLVSYIFDKYIRLILSIVTIIALTIVTPLLAIESPVWRNFVEQQSSICKSNGYLNLFFLQNFIAYDKICLPHTWLFCVELQLIILAIPLVLLLKKCFLSTEDLVIIGDEVKLANSSTSHLFRVILSRLLASKAGLLSAMLLLIGVFINLFLVYTNQLPPSWFYSFPDVAQKNYYFGHYLTKTWTHLSVFLVGLIGGHLCRATLQLQAIQRLKSQQQTVSSSPSNTTILPPVHQPSPVPSSSTGSSRLQSHSGSTSTIMAMEQGGQSSLSTSSCHQEKQQKLAQIQSVSLQMASLICMLALIFSTYNWSTQEGPSPMVAAAYDSLSRLLWSLALVSIMIQLCLPNERTGRPSKPAQLLSRPICTLAGRLSFLAYLLVPYVHTFVLAVEEQSLFPSLFIVFHVIVGNIVIVYVLAFVLAIVIEQPLRRLISRFVLGKRFRRQRVNISLYCTNSSSKTLDNSTVE